jgi:mycofactocin precursor peptide peptidase
VSSPAADGIESVLLGTSTWTELYEGRRPLIAVPVGSCEQHGPHLPLDTDSRVAEALAAGLAGSFGPGEILVGPTLSITASGEHASFPGTLSIGNEAMAQVLIELVRSADWSSGVVLVNGHGGNARAVRDAVRLLQTERRRVLAWWPSYGSRDATNPERFDAHAGYTETSLMLAIAPHLVRRDRAVAGDTRPISQVVDQLREGGVSAVSRNGVLGDPAGASAAHGRSLLTRWTIDLVAAVDEWWE